MPGIDDYNNPKSQVTYSCPCPALPGGMVVVRTIDLKFALNGCIGDIPIAESLWPRWFYRLKAALEEKHE